MSARLQALDFSLCISGLSFSDYVVDANFELSEIDNNSQKSWRGEIRLKDPHSTEGPGILDSRIGADNPFLPGREVIFQLKDSFGVLYTFFTLEIFKSQYNARSRELRIIVTDRAGSFDSERSDEREILPSMEVGDVVTRGQLISGIYRGAGINLEAIPADGRLSDTFRSPPLARDGSDLDVAQQLATVAGYWIIQDENARGRWYRWADSENIAHYCKSDELEIFEPILTDDRLPRRVISRGELQSFEQGSFTPGTVVEVIENVMGTRTSQNPVIYDTFDIPGEDLIVVREVTRTTVSTPNSVEITTTTRVPRSSCVFRDGINRGDLGILFTQPNFVAGMTGIGQPAIFLDELIVLEEDVVTEVFNPAETTTATQSIDENRVARFTLRNHYDPFPAGTQPPLSTQEELLTLNRVTTTWQQTMTPTNDLADRVVERLQFGLLQTVRIVNLPNNPGTGEQAEVLDGPAVPNEVLAIVDQDTTEISRPRGPIGRQVVEGFQGVCDLEPFYANNAIGQFEETIDTPYAFSDEQQQFVANIRCDQLIGRENGFEIVGDIPDQIRRSRRLADWGRIVIDDNLFWVDSVFFAFTPNRSAMGFRGLFRGLVPLDAPNRWVSHVPAIDTGVLAVPEFPEITMLEDGNPGNILIPVFGALPQHDGFTGGYEISATGLPPGMRLTNSQIEGIPIQSGVFMPTITVTQGVQTIVQTLKIEVRGAGVEQGAIPVGTTIISASIGFGAEVQVDVVGAIINVDIGVGFGVDVNAVVAGTVVNAGIGFGVEISVESDTVVEAGIGFGADVSVVPIQLSPVDIGIGFGADVNTEMFVTVDIGIGVGVDISIPGQGLSWFDSFIATDGTTLDAYVPPINPDSLAYAVGSRDIGTGVLSTLTINDNSFDPTTGTADGPIVDIQSQDVIISSAITPTTSSSIVSLVSRYESEGNAYELTVNTRDGLLVLSRRQSATTLTQLASQAFAFVAGTQYLIELVHDGANIEAFIDGVSTLTAVDSILTGSSFGVAEFDSGMGGQEERVNDLVISEVGRFMSADFNGAAFTNLTVYQPHIDPLASGWVGVAFSPSQTPTLATSQLNGSSAVNFPANQGFGYDLGAGNGNAVMSFSYTLPTASPGRLLAVVRYQDTSLYLAVLLDDLNNRLGIARLVNGVFQFIGTGLDFTYVVGQTYNVTVEVSAGDISVWIDDVFQLTGSPGTAEVGNGIFGFTKLAPGDVLIERLRLQRINA